MSNNQQKYVLIPGSNYTVNSGIINVTSSGGSAAAPYTNMSMPGAYRAAGADESLINMFSHFNFPQDVQDRGFFVKGFILPLWFQVSSPTFAQMILRMSDTARFFRTPSLAEESQSIIISSSSNILHNTDNVITPANAWTVQAKPSTITCYLDRAFERQQTPSGVGTPSSWQLVQRATVPGIVSPQVTTTNGLTTRGLWGTGANGAAGQPLVGVTTQINGSNAPLPPLSNLLLPETGIMNQGTGRDLTTGSAHFGQRHYALQISVDPTTTTTGFIGNPTLIVELCS